MTIISSVQTEELKAFPPVNAAIDKVKAIDWELMQIRGLICVNYVGKGLSILGRGIYTLGEALTKA